MARNAPRTKARSVSSRMGASVEEEGDAGEVGGTAQLYAIVRVEWRSLLRRPGLTTTWPYDDLALRRAPPSVGSAPAVENASGREPLPNHGPKAEIRNANRSDDSQRRWVRQPFSSP